MEPKDLSFSSSSAHSTVLSHLPHSDDSMYLSYLMCWEDVVWIKQAPKEAGKENWLTERLDGLAEVPFILLSVFDLEGFPN